MSISLNIVVTWPIYISLTALTALIVWQIGYTLFHYISKYKRRLVDVPVINLKGEDYAAAVHEYIHNAAELYRMGRQKYPDKPFQIWGTEGYMLVIPETWVEELKDLDTAVADNTALIKSVLGDYPWVELDYPAIIHSMATRVTPQLGTLVDAMVDELRYVLDTELPACKEWTSITAVPFMMRVIALVSGRTFVDHPLNRNPLWISSGIDYATDIFSGGEKLRKLPYLLKILSIKLGLIPEINTVARRKRDARTLLVPILQKRRKEKLVNPDWTAPNDMMQFIMDSPHSRNSSLEEQAEIQLVVAFSSIQATSQVGVNVLFDLCARPEYLEPLRKEIEEVLAEEGGKMTKKALGKMVKLDSFMKESQRLHPSQLTTFDRIASSPQGIKLKNGFHIPHGTRFAVPSWAIHVDSEILENAAEFDGFRYARLRSTSTKDSMRYQFVSTNSHDSLSFGHGKHACPGRFFAGAEIKLIVARLIREYDFKFAEGVEGRPESLVFGHNARPDPSVRVLFRRRE